MSNSVQMLLINMLIDWIEFYAVYISHVTAAYQYVKPLLLESANLPKWLSLGRIYCPFDR